MGHCVYCKTGFTSVCTLNAPDEAVATVGSWKFITAAHKTKEVRLKVGSSSTKGVRLLVCPVLPTAITSFPALVASAQWVPCLRSLLRMIQVTVNPDTH